MRSKHILALDFDGLLVDGLNECVLVSWNGHHGEGLERFSDAALAQIPPDFVERFKHHRSFAKHLGHFLMPFQARFDRFCSQGQFDEAYDTLASEAIEQFMARVTAYRNGARQVHRQRWLNYHTFYPGLREWLAQTSTPVCIVTAKDSASVQELLANAGIAIPDEHIHGECREKLGALAAVAKHFGVPRHRVRFFDDNVLNARDALDAGFDAHWAVWGYHAPEHFGIARDAGLPEVGLEDLIQAGLETVA